MKLINTIRKQIQPILPIPENPAPLVLDGTWKDLHQGYLINVQDTTSLGLWLNLTNISGFKIRVLATYSKDSNDFYQLPIQSPTSTIVGLEVQEYEFINALPELKIVLSIPTADVLNYLKIQITGSGNVEKAFVTARDN